MEAMEAEINYEEVAEVIYEILLQINQGKDLTLTEKDIQDDDFKKVMKEVKESLVQFKGEWQKSSANLKKMCVDLEDFLKKSKYFKIAGASVLVAGAAATIGLAFLTWGGSLVASLIGAAIGGGLQVGRNVHNGYKTKASLNKLIKELKPLEAAAKSVEAYLVQLILKNDPSYTKCSHIIDGITEELKEKRDQQVINVMKEMGEDLKNRIKFILKIATTTALVEVGKGIIHKVLPEGGEELVQIDPKTSERLGKLLSGHVALAALNALGTVDPKTLIPVAFVAFDIATIMSTAQELQKEIKPGPVKLIQDEIKEIDEQFKENSTQIVIDFIHDALEDLKNAPENTESLENYNSSESV